MSEEIDRISKFIYLDMERVKSITARMNEGYIKEKVEEQRDSEQDSETLTSAIKASIFGIGGSISKSDTKTESEANLSRQTRGLHHYHYTILESMLEDQEGRWFHDLRDSENAREAISEGDIVKIFGDLQISDFKTSFNMIEGLLEALEDDQLQKMFGEDKINPKEFYERANGLNIPKTGNKIEGINTIFSMFRSFLPSKYENMITGKLRNNDAKFWSTLNREKLESDPTEILTKYEDSKIPKCTVVARVDTITKDLEEKVGVELEDSKQFGMFHHMADQIAVEMGLKVQYPAIAITPIAIYR